MQRPVSPPSQPAPRTFCPHPLARTPRRSALRSAVAPALFALSLALLAAPAAFGEVMQDRYELRDDGWQTEASPDIETPEGQLQVVRRVLADDRPHDAERLADLWIANHPNHALMAEARMLRGDALVMRGREYGALFDYEYIIRVYPDSPQFHRALEREYDIASQFVEGRRRHLWGMRILPAYSEGEELLIRIQERAPGSELGERASLRLAEYYYHRGDMADAAEAYDLFLLNYPQSTRREEAMQRLIQASLARVSGPAFDPTGLIEAQERLRVYREEFPAGAEQLGADALDVRIDESLAAKDLRAARWHERRGERVSAAYLYQRLMDEYPLTPAAEEAGERLAALDLPVNPGLDAGGRRDIEQPDAEGGAEGVDGNADLPQDADLPQQEEGQ